VDVPGELTSRSGTFARAVFRGAPRRVLVVPPAAIQRHGQVSSVYVVRDGVARLRLVQAGPGTAAGVEILAGLDAGELVVTAPMTRMADGAKVAVRAAGQPEGDTP
jgi:hypothetical protein